MDKRERVHVTDPRVLGAIALEEEATKAVQQAHGKHVESDAIEICLQSGGLTGVWAKTLRDTGILQDKQH